MTQAKPPTAYRSSNGLTDYERNALGAYRWAQKNDRVLTDVAHIRLVRNAERRLIADYAARIEALTRKLAREQARKRAWRDEAESAS